MAFELRPYQQQAVDFAMNHGKDDRPIHCAPTGSGKTVIQAFTAARELDRDNRTAILTPRAEIFDQTLDLTQQICGENNVTTLRANHQWDRHKPIHIVSWPTLTARMRRSEAWLPDVERVLVDECHLAMAPRCKEILEYYEDKAVIDGYTATPARKSGLGLGRFFTEIKHVTSVRQLIKEGFLCPMEYYAGATIDVRGLKKQAGDYAAGGKMSDSSIQLVGDVVDNWLRLAKDRHTIVFAVDVAHAEALNDRFCKVGIASGVVHSRMDDDKRAETVRQFKALDLQVLVNVTIASYGFDDPEVNCVQVCRPTMSEVLHLQMLGRGMRPGPDKVCMVLDHAGNVTRLGFANDLFRWTLDEGKQATKNWTRMTEEGEADSIECEECHNLYAGTRRCPKCGWEKPFAKRDVDVLEGNLVRIGGVDCEPLPDGFPDHQMLYRMLIYFGREQEYKSGWSAVKFKELAGAWPERSWSQYAGVPPSDRVLNWIIKQQQNYARRQSYAKRAAANKAG